MRERKSGDMNKGSTDICTGSCPEQMCALRSQTRCCVTCFTLSAQHAAWLHVHLSVHVSVFQGVALDSCACFTLQQQGVHGNIRYDDKQLKPRNDMQQRLLATA